ncbi:MAG: 3-hydroxyacyl-CoA dehydrogenase NAD-binding domain-containing protein [Nitrospirota bacterium]|nr:3-hydroxyacyl-CoA dehydrogenase NAD-binding domain-containing protein [Nitrospirota bacterium]
MSAFHYEIDSHGIAVLTFDLPDEKVNKLTTAVMDELSRILDDLSISRTIKALVIRSGKPDNFIAGADISEIRNITDADLGEELSRNGQEVLQKIEDLPFPTVAAINGACLGGGLELALACRYRVVSSGPRTVLGLPEVKLGIIPGFGGTQRLPRLVGLANSLDMILTGKSVYPRKAKRIGLADEVTYKENLLPAAVALAKKAIDTAAPKKIRARRPLAMKVLESNPLTRSFIYRKAENEIRKETRGNYPAPLAALDAVRHGLIHGKRAGYAHEALLIGQLIASPVAKNLIHVYYLSEILKKEARTSAVSIDHAAVTGAGIMGAGIAQLLAEKGLSVRLRDVNTKAVGAGLRTAHDIFRKRMKKGIVTAIQARDGMDRIAGGPDLAGFAQADLTIEAVIENMDVKKQVLRDFETVARPDAIFATNTSSLSVTELASAAQRPGRVVGMHFFNPVEKMPLVEIVRGKQTDPAVVAAISALSVKLGKLPVVVNDGPGFLVNRILMPFLTEAARMLEEGESIDHIDSVLMKFGMPMGAFVLLDEIGIDVAYKVAGILHKGLGDRVAPPDLLKRLYKEGYYGKKNGKGFYCYEGRERKGPDPVVLSLIASTNGHSKTIPDQEIIDRTILLMIKEAALCIEEGIIDRPDLLDAALVFGIGFPPFRGGLLKFADDAGAKEIVEKLDDLAKRLGDRFSPPKSLFEMSRDDFISQVVS